MCQPSLRAKFCTCASDKPVGYPRWELWRSNQEQDNLEVHAVGSFMPPELDHELLVDRVLHDLNRPDAFDTDLGFQNGDKLVLHWRRGASMAFRYDIGKWSNTWRLGFWKAGQDRPLAVGRLEAHRR